MNDNPPMGPPRHILDRVERVYAYHQASKLAFAEGAAPTWPAPPNDIDKPLFADRGKIPLPTILLDAPLGALAALESSLEALPDSFVAPPQTLKTLASWLYMADGMLGDRRQLDGRHEVRTLVSEGDRFPFEIYVAAFSIDELEPGLYHYDPRDFVLRRLRDGPDTLAQIKRGRPDLEFIKRAPAALLISTTYRRLARGLHGRGYRAGLLDAGRLAQNLVVAACGIGIQTIVRLRMTDSTMRELIGVEPRADMSQQESVQSMVVWADRSQREAIWMHVPKAPHKEEAASFPSADRAEVAPQINVGGAAVASLELTDLSLPSMRKETLAPIPRTAGLIHNAGLDEVLAIQQCCVATGVGVREIRAPLTEMTPMPAGYPTMELGQLSRNGHGAPLGNILLRPQPATGIMQRHSIGRDMLRTLSRMAFRGGSYFPLFPSGVHSALIRPFWVLHHVSGMDDGLWFYQATDDSWCLLRSGDMRFELQYLTMYHPCFSEAAAVCVMVAAVQTLMLQGGPDTYRLAHLEAGTAENRLGLAARGLELASSSTLLFYDEDVRKFLGLSHTTWEPLVMTAIGVPPAGLDKSAVTPVLAEGDWRG